MEFPGDLLKAISDIGCLKFGKFILKSGIQSPVYVDLRIIISYPLLLKEISQTIWKIIKEKCIEADVLCGVPYTALPIASTISVLNDIPMVLKRKAAKDYGTKKIVEGIFKEGQKCLIIEDVVTTGSSVIETAKELRSQGLVVTDCIVILDREEGGHQNLEEDGIHLHPLFKFRQTISSCSKMNYISSDLVQEVERYLSGPKVIDKSKSLQPFLFSDSNGICKSRVLNRLLQLIRRKKTNLCIAVDVIKKADLLNMADQLGPYICILKTHVDILEDFDKSVGPALKSLSQKHDFLILEDKKFADIGATVVNQYKGGIFKIQEWADLITVHSIPGEAALNALKENSTKDQGCFLIAQMSSQGALTSTEYVDKTIALAEKHSDYVVGFIAQSRFQTNSEFLFASPGVNLSTDGDAMGQKYRNVETAIQKDGVDIIIVGRGITAADDIVEAAKLYMEKAYEAINALG